MPIGVPPALPGRHSKFDRSGNGNQPLSREPLKVQRKRGYRERRREIIPHAVGVQVSCRVYTEMSAKESVPGVKETPGAGFSGIGPTEGKLDRRRPLVFGPCTYVGEYSAEICGVAGGGVCEGEKCDSHSEELWGSISEFHGRTFLGPWILRIDGWAG